MPSVTRYQVPWRTRCPRCSAVGHAGAGWEGLCVGQGGAYCLRSLIQVKNGTQARVCTSVDSTRFLFVFCSVF